MTVFVCAMIGYSLIIAIGVAYRKSEERRQDAKDAKLLRDALDYAERVTRRKN